MKGHQIIDTKEALKFMFAGKSTVTFLNSQTGNRFTFKLKSAKESNIFFVSVLTGPDNYSYIGTCQEGNYKHGRKSKISQTAQSVRVFQFMLDKLKSGNLPENLQVWHEAVAENVAEN